MPEEINYKVKFMDKYLTKTEAYLPDMYILKAKQAKKMRKINKFNL